MLLLSVFGVAVVIACGIQKRDTFWSDLLADVSTFWRDRIFDGFA
jgi:hypothetical protein